jgi:hypothetical protein
MVSLTNPINRQNIVNRFADYVQATANASIVWGTNALPFTGMAQPQIFGGPTSGKSIEISGSNLGTQINANVIYDTLIAETTRYTRIRNVKVTRFVTGDIGGETFNQTAVAHLTSAYQASTSAVRGTVVSQGLVQTTPLEALFNNMRASYNAVRAVSAGTFTTTVCHASCHASCHGSRARR